jgi:hypothetical protein
LYELDSRGTKIQIVEINIKKNIRKEKMPFPGIEPGLVYTDEANTQPHSYYDEQLKLGNYLGVNIDVNR